MKLFKDLNENQEAEFRQWARDNYAPFTPIEGIWHPVIQDECAKINAEQDFIKGDPPLKLSEMKKQDPRAYDDAVAKRAFAMLDASRKSRAENVT